MDNVQGIAKQKSIQKVRKHTNELLRIQK